MEEMINGRSFSPREAGTAVHVDEEACFDAWREAGYNQGRFTILSRG